MSTAKLSALLLVVAGVAFLFGQAVPGPAASASSVSIQPEGDMDAAMAAMIAAGQPGEHHRHLDHLVGTWEGTMKWTPAPGAPAMEFPGKAVREWALDGRFLMETVNADSPGGDPFVGIGYTGFNNLDQRYETVWLENMSTVVSVGHGSFDPARNVFMFYGERRDPLSGRVITSWSEIDVSDPDREVLKGWEIAEDGSVFQNMEAVFSRR